MYNETLKKYLDYLISNLNKNNDIFLVEKKSSDSFVKYEDEENDILATLTTSTLRFRHQNKTFLIEDKSSIFGKINNTVFTSQELHSDPFKNFPNFFNDFLSLYNITKKLFSSQSLITYNIISGEIYHIISYMYPDEIDRYLTITNHPELLSFHNTNIKHIIQDDIFDMHFVLNTNHENFKKDFNDFKFNVYKEEFPEKNIDDFNLDLIKEY
jgi:hypothetical protein